MLTIQDLILREISKKNAIELAHIASNNKYILNELWNFALSDKAPLNWRSAWVMKSLWEISPSLIEPFIGKMILALPGLKKEGVKREFLRMIQEYPLPEDDEKLGVLLDICFSWLANAAEPVADVCLL